MTDWHRTETYKSLISISTEAFKMLALINGGAAVALLTYLGNLAAKSNTTSLVPDLRWPISLYCAGLVFVLLCFFGSYLTQLFLYNEKSDRSVEKHVLPLRLSMISAFASVLCFAIGSWLAASALTTIR